jgi:hypothetical protein
MVATLDYIGRRLLCRITVSFHMNIYYLPLTFSKHADEQSFPPVAHKVYGVPQTINSANYVYFLAYQELFSLRPLDSVDRKSKWQLPFECNSVILFRSLARI